MTHDVPALIAKLQGQIVALGDIGDCRTDNERARHRQTLTSLQVTISGLQTAPQEVEQATEQLALFEAQHTEWLQKQNEIEQAISDAPDVETIRDLRVRDKEIDRQRHLCLSLQRLREGTLLAAPGVTYWPLEEIDAKIEERKKRRDRAQQALNALVQRAETLVRGAVTTSS
jgi:hypothetical protein